MKTSIYEADPFTSRRGALITIIDTDYRWEKGDEIAVESGGDTSVYRVIQVRVRLRGCALERDVVAMKL